MSPSHRPGRAASGSPESRSRRAIRVALIILGVLIGVLLAYAAYTYFSVSSRLAPPKEERAAIEGELDTLGSSENEVYILILGNDRRPGQGWARSDTIILARLDGETRTASLLSLPRDSYVEVPGRGMTKLNHASAWGGPALMIKTVKQLTGLPVHHYVETDFEGFESIVDALGGVQMTVDTAVTSPEGVRVEGGTRMLSGAEALAFVRNRKGYADGDFARMRNQQAFMLSLARQASKPGNVPRLPGILNAVSQNVQTDMSVGQIVDLAGDYRGVDSDTMRAATAPGKPQSIGRVSYVVLDEQKFREVVADLADGGFAPAE